MKTIRLFVFVTKLALFAGLITHSSVWSQGTTLYTTGFNEPGQLGTGDYVSQNTPTLITIPGGKSIVQCSGGDFHSLMVSSDNQLYVAGASTSGQLGVGGSILFNPSPAHVAIPGNKGVVQCSAGSEHSLVVTTDGELYAMGLNDEGQLGIGDYVGRHTPTLIPMPGGKSVARVDAGIYHSLIVTIDGELYAMGSNDSWQLGTGDSVDRTTPTLIAIPEGKSVDQVAAGFEHSLLLTTDGNLYVVGSNEFGQLGTGDNVDRETLTHILIPGGRSAARIAVGDCHSLVVTTDGELYTVGHNEVGQLGTGDNTDRNNLTLVSVPGGKGVARIEAATVHSLLVTTDGEPYGMGWNEPGQLGTGDNTDRNTPTLIALPDGKVASRIGAGWYHSMFIGRDPVDASKTYNLFANTESYQYYPLNENGAIEEPVSYEVVGSLPQGLKICDGVLQGVIPNTGTYRFVIVLTGGPDQTTLDFTLKVMPPTMQPVFTGVYLNGVLSTTTIVEGSTHTTPAVTELYNATVAVNTPLTMSFIWDFIKVPTCYCMVGGDFPDGLVLNGDTGEITGTPTEAGEYIFVVSVMDWRGRAFQWIRLVVE